MKNKNFNRGEIKLKILMSTLVLALLFFSFLFSSSIEKFLNMNSIYAKNEVSGKTFEQTDFSVNYLDVGQGNSSVIFLPDGKVAVIDGGSSFYGEKVYEFLIDNGAEKIDYLIATHADSDHIGGQYILPPHADFFVYMRTVGAFLLDRRKFH